MSKYRDVEKLIGDFKKVEDTAGHAKEFFSLLADLLEGAPTVEVATKGEVARAIFEEIEEMCIDFFGNFNHRMFIEIKKKYTEGE
jgi:hypothetical protein